MRNQRLHTAVYVAALMFISLTILHGQESSSEGEGAEEESIEEGAPAQESAEEGSAEQDVSTQESAAEETLEQRTRAQDIIALDFFQLQAWLRREDLSTRGNVDELRRRLFEYYNLDPSALSAEDSRAENDLQVFIESAEEGSYFDIEEVEEQYVRLRGGVRMRLVDRAENTTHTIEAQEIIFNQAQDLVTARGEVIYLIERPESTETFSGKTLIFQVGDWEGFFVEGSGDSPGTGDDAIDYRYRADLISRSEEGVVVMENAIITSSPAEDPYYRLQASKIWIIGAGEWALEDAVLYVGDIPLFYFPYFFRPGDEIVFHPVFGAQIRNGTFIQTTTYLRGRKPRAEDRFSFLQTESVENKRKYLDGIFLRASAELLPSGELNSADTLKLIVDYYTNLGAYLALEGSFSSLEVVTPLEFNFALSYSRHLYSTGRGVDQFTSTYTQDGRAQEFPVNSNFFGVSIPLRYILETEFGISAQQFSANLLFQLYSDRYITQDFEQRSEDNDFYGLIIGEREFLEQNTASEISSFVWRLGASYNVGALISPFISQFAIQDFVLLVNWNSKLVPTTLLNDYVLAANNSPERYFFFPQTIVAPNIRLSMGGTILSPEIVAGRATPDEDREISIISYDARPPWGRPKEEEEDEEEDGDSEIEFRNPTSFANLTGYTPRLPLNYSLTYTLQPALNIQLNTNNREWDQADDIDFSVQYSSLTSDNSLQLGYMLDLYQRYLFFSGNFDFIGRYRTLLESENLTESENTLLLNDAYAYTYFGILNTTTLSSFFLQEFAPLSGTNVSYSIGTRLYQYQFKELDSNNNPVYEPTMVDFDEETITSHNLQLQFAWQALAASQQLTLSYQLPPLDQQVSALLTLVFGPLQLSSNFSATEIDNEEMGNEETDVEWKLNNLTSSATLNIIDNLSLSANTSVNLDEAYIQSVRASLTAWFVNVSFSADYLRDVTFNSNFLNEGLANPWQESGEQELRPRAISIRIAENFTPEALWKNRFRSSVSINSSLEWDLQRYTNSFFTFGFGLTFFIFEFLDLTISTNVRNSQIYIYFDDLARRVGRTPRNFFEDFFRSINIFNPSDLEAGLFKLENISVQATHNLADWDLVFSYTASPLLRVENNRPEYVWDQMISISIAWRALPELQREITIDRDDEVTIE